MGHVSSLFHLSHNETELSPRQLGKLTLLQKAGRVVQVQQETKGLRLKVKWNLNTNNIKELKKNNQAGQKSGHAKREQFF